MESEKSKDCGGAFTVNVNVVVCEREPAAPVTVIVDDPVGVDAEVVRVTVEEHVGLHDPGEKELVAPAGRPEAVKDTDCEAPETRVAVIVFVTDCPAVKPCAATVVIVTVVPASLAEAMLGAA